MTTVAKLRSMERAQDEWIIQSIGEAIRQSFQAIIREPLPDRMALLLLQMALAETISPGNDEAWKSHISGLMDEPETELEKATRHIVGAKQLRTSMGRLAFCYASYRCTGRLYAPRGVNERSRR